MDIQPVTKQSQSADFASDAQFKLWRSHAMHNGGRFCLSVDCEHSHSQRLLRRWTMHNISTKVYSDGKWKWKRWCYWCFIACNLMQARYVLWLFCLSPSLSQLYSVNKWQKLFSNVLFSSPNSQVILVFFFTSNVVFYFTIRALNTGGV